MDPAGGAAAATYMIMKQRMSREKKKNIDKESVRGWECVQLTHHNDIGRKIEEWESNGWVLYAYTAASFQSTVVNHYLLFFKEE
jgi:hypothetical protein